ncbi:MAG: UDP-N-acetylmuramate dehydrogenase [Defluviitaleaceae bacterium]|nr:UDP-N-acetylmuramate dehydrogenase [Defluviitaleaceae bacterium]
MFDTTLFRQNFEPHKLLVGEPMSRHTTFCIGGPAAVMLLPDCAEDIVTAVELAGFVGAPIFVTGGGSNLLVSDSGINAVVIKLGRDFARAECEDGIITAQAGLSLAALADTALAQELAGLEFSAGIPGSLGGAVFMNAGAYGEEMSGVVQSVQLLERGELVTRGADGLGFGYRTSGVLTGGGIVLSATLRLEPGRPEDILAKMEDLAAQRRDKQPLEYPSAGSAFKRPPGRFAGKLVDDAGLRGFAVGGAQISVKHAGFIINTGGATAQDVRALIAHVQERVFKLFGVELEPEVRMVGGGV